MSQQVYRFIKFLEQKEGREIPSMAKYKYEHVKNLTEKEIIDILKNVGDYIRIVEQAGIKITHEMMLAALSNDGDLLGFIKSSLRQKIQRWYLPNNELTQEELDQFKIPKDLQLAAVNSRGESIKYIDNPSEDVQIAAVLNSHIAIRYIKNPTADVAILYIKKYGKYFLYDILDKDIKNSPRVKEAILDFCRAKYGEIPQYVKDSFK